MSRSPRRKAKLARKQADREAGMRRKRNRDDEDNNDDGSNTDDEALFDTNDQSKEELQM